MSSALRWLLQWWSAGQGSGQWREGSVESPDSGQSQVRPVQGGWTCDENLGRDPGEGD